MRGDLGFLRGGIGEALQPCLIHWRQYFGDHGVDAHAPRREGCRPFAGQAELCGFGGDIGGGATLACHRRLGGDVDDGPYAGLEVGLQQVAEGIGMQQVPVERGAEGFGWGVEAQAALLPALFTKP
ncbi:MAG: hypothetical protein U1A24_01210 [Cypionkella sp.]|nr:hypothetical protein [Cypionkella sp.]MDZ4309165.1 hypothetical protein [Cypionkella sp.]